MIIETLSDDEYAILIAGDVLALDDSPRLQLVRVAKTLAEYVLRHPPKPQAKPLVWEDSSENHWRALTSFGWYMVGKNRWGLSYWQFNSDCRYCDSTDQGKQLAEQDWQQRVSEAVQ